MRKSMWRITFLCLGILLFSTTTVVLMRLERAGKMLPQPETPSTTFAKRERGFMIGVWEGQLAVFEIGDPQPTQVYEVFVASLPFEEQVRLKAGVIVPDRPALAALIEDYTS